MAPGFQLIFQQSEGIRNARGQKVKSQASQNSVKFLIDDCGSVSSGVVELYCLGANPMYLSTKGGEDFMKMVKVSDHRSSNITQDQPYALNEGDVFSLVITDYKWMLRKQYVGHNEQ